MKNKKFLWNYLMIALTLVMLSSCGINDSSSSSDSGDSSNQSDTAPAPTASSSEPEASAPSHEEIAKAADEAMEADAARGIRTLQTVYVVYDENQGIEEPYCGTPNQIEITNDPGYSTFIQKKDGTQLALATFQSEEFIEYLKRMEEKGVSLICYWEKTGKVNGFLARKTKVDLLLSSD